jgi:hypothetical protein
MTATESAALHERLHQELRLSSQRQESQQPRRRWVPVVSWVAGVAAVFVAVLALTPVLSGGDDADSADTVSMRDFATATTAASFEAALPEAVTEAGDDATMGGLAEDGSAELDEAATEAVETTAAASEEDFGVVAVGNLDEDLRTQILANLDPVVDLAPDRQVDPLFEACLEEDAIARSSDGFLPPVGVVPVPLGLITGEDGQDRLLVAYPAREVADTLLAAISLPSCEVYQTTP